MSMCQIIYIPEIGTNRVSLIVQTASGAAIMGQIRGYN
jgi:hypothetical protein